MSDTRAVARLPGLDIEIRHKEAPDEGAEYLSINLKATPDFRTAAQWLDPFALWGGAALFNPWLLWHQTFQSMMVPFLSAEGRTVLPATKRKVPQD